jgi:hypothetical protein
MAHRNRTKPEPRVHALFMDGNRAARITSMGDFSLHLDLRPASRHCLPMKTAMRASAICISGIIS